MKGWDAKVVAASIMPSSASFYTNFIGFEAQVQSTKTSGSESQVVGYNRQNTTSDMNMTGGMEFRRAASFPDMPEQHGRSVPRRHGEGQSNMRHVLLELTLIFPASGGENRPMISATQG
jgi:hypothetical protein